MLEPKWLNHTVAAAGQIDRNEIVDAAHRGFTTIINNRPDDESGGQHPDSAGNREVAEAHGMRYAYLPLSGLDDLTTDLLDGYAEALDNADGAVLAHCKTGARSTLLWAIVQVRNKGRDVETVMSETRKAGYDLTQARPILDRYTTA